MPRALQIENALRATVDAAILDREIGFYGIDPPFINEARALLEGDSTPTAEEGPA